MNRIIGIILEMVFVSLLTVFLLAYLLRGRINGGTGVWDGMGQVEITEADTPEYTLNEQTKVILAAQVPDIYCPFHRVKLNQIYELAELFANAQDSNCFLEINDVFLGKESVLARGDIDELSEAETPAGALYDANTGRLMFTKTGSYRVSLRVGTVYGAKPYKDIWITIMAVSDAVLETAKTGEN
jgi:hypothetical protein